MRRHNNGEVNPSLEGRTISDLQTWFLSEATKCFKRFAAYLDFSSWKAPAGLKVSAGWWRNFCASG